MNRRISELTSSEAEKQYGGYWTLNVLNRKDGQHLCYCCESPSAGRSSMNIWGTICDFETCDECHAKVDGHRADSIPEFAVTAETKGIGV
jgi:ribosomal protein L37AE/L43A